MKTGLWIPLVFSVILHMVIIVSVTLCVGQQVDKSGYGNQITVFLRESSRKNPGTALRAGVAGSVGRAPSAALAKSPVSVRHTEGAVHESEPTPSFVITEPPGGNAVRKEGEYQPKRPPVFVSDTSVKNRENGADKSESAGLEETSPDNSIALPNVKPAQTVLERVTPVSAGYSGWSEKGVVSWRGVPGLKRPVYPRRSREHNEQGRVVLIVKLFLNGTLGEIKVLHSSGHKRLDRAALRAVKRSSFIAMQGLPSIKIAYNFRLEDE